MVSFNPNKGPYLRELKPGQRFTGFFAVLSATLEPFRDASRGNFLTLILSDASGQMIGRVWENAEEAAKQVEPHQVIKLEGDVDTYLDRLQIRILRLRPAQPDEFDSRDFLPASARPAEEMLAELDGFRQMITDPHLRSLVDHFFANPAFLADFARAPASLQAHHPYLGGLLEHTLQMLQLCGTVITLYPAIDASLLLAGAFLREIGKVRAYAWSLVLELSDDGRLLGPIALTDEMVTNALRDIEDFPPDLALRVRHLLIVQPGQSIPPQSLEAVALEQIEQLDAQISGFLQQQDGFSGQAPGE